MGSLVEALKRSHMPSKKTTTKKIILNAIILAQGQADISAICIKFNFILKQYLRVSITHSNRKIVSFILEKTKQNSESHHNFQCHLPVVIGRRAKAPDFL